MLIILLISDIISITVLGVYLFSRKRGKADLLYADYSLLENITDDSMRRNFMYKSSILLVSILLLDLLIINILVILDIKSVVINTVCYFIMIMLIIIYCILYKKMYKKLKVVDHTSNNKRI